MNSQLNIRLYLNIKFLKKIIFYTKKKMSDFEGLNESEIQVFAIYIYIMSKYYVLIEIKFILVV